MFNKKEFNLPKKDYIFPFRMDQDFRKKLKKAANKIGFTMSQYIRVAIIEKFNRDK